MEHRTAERLPDEARVQMHPDHEHVERDADLAERREQAKRVRGEQHRLRGRREEAEQRRTEQDAGNHFANDLRLADARHQRPDGFAGNEDDGELKKE